MIQTELDKLLAEARAEGYAAGVEAERVKHDAFIEQLDEVIANVALCAVEHSNFEATLHGLKKEVDELEAALQGKHEHTPESELIQIAAIAINWVRQLGHNPVPEYVVSEAMRHHYNRGVVDERERCAEIARMWDWRKSGDNTNEHIADAIEAGDD